MTFQRIWVWVRWPLALLLMVAIVRYALPRFGDALGDAVSLDFGEGSIFGSGTESPTATPTATGPAVDLTLLQPPNGPVLDGAATPVADFSASEGSIGEVGLEELVIGDILGDTVLVAFNLVEGDPDCLLSMTLDVEVVDATQTEVGVHPTLQGDAAQLDQFSAVEDPLLFPGAPVDLALVGAPGRLQLDVLPAYRAIFNALPAGSVFTLGLIATSGVEEGGGVTFASSETGERGPLLTWTGAPGCGEDAAGTSTASPAAIATATATPTE